VETGLLMRTEASPSLNFLIYIQNIYLNQTGTGENNRFPYVPTKVAFAEAFEERFQELWKNVSRKIAEHPFNDVKILHDKQDIFYQELFENAPDSFNGYREIYKAFNAWWGSFAGGFAVERSMDEMGHTLYLELANSLKQRGIEPRKELQLHLIYDECQLANAETAPYFAVLAIKDFFVANKELVPKILAILSE